MGNDGEDLEEIDFKKIAGNVGKSLKSFGRNLRYSVSSPKDCTGRGEEIVKIAKSKGITDPGQLSYLKDLEINNCREEQGLGKLASVTPGGFAYDDRVNKGGGYNESQINEMLTGQDAVYDFGKMVLQNVPGAENILSTDPFAAGGNAIGMLITTGVLTTAMIAAAVNKYKQMKKSKSVSSTMDSGEDGEISEAISTIKTLRNELNEVNLLNAKLLYVNKIFKAKNLTESQKLKVIASFDKATTAKEAKVVFESLNSTLTTSAPKQAIKESLGFASRAAGVAPRKAIVETNDAITRMQKLANIIK
jgi:hypothetical protein